MGFKNRKKSFAFKKRVNLAQFLRSVNTALAQVFPEKSNRSGRLSTVDLPVLTSLDELRFILKMNL